MAATDRFLQANGLRLHYVDFGGDGRPIVLQHGVTGHAWVWGGVAESLTSLGRVVALDYRGFGDSQWAASGDYSTDDLAADLGALVSELGADEVDLVGSSWGGLVSIAYADANPDRVRRLALVDVPISSTQAEEEVPPMTYDFANHEEVVAAERGAHPNAPDELIELAATRGTRPGEEGRLYRKRDPVFMRRWPFRADDRWSQLASLQMPVLVVHAANSFIPAEVAERMDTTAAQSSLVEIARSGHVVPMENPSALAEALVEFLSDRARS
jgi:pimeloyl-ACP methyl ester carboxylesterase